MNKMQLFTAAILGAAALSACKDDKSFTISGTIKNPAEANKVYLLAADTTEIRTVDSTTLSEDGKFTFKNQSAYPNLYKVRAGGVIFDLIASNGDEIKFETDLKDQTHQYNVAGSEESDKIKEFNALSNVYAAQNNKVMTEIQERMANTVNQDSVMAIYRPQFMNIIDQYGKAAWKFINNNKKSLAAFYAAMSLEPSKNEQQLIAYADDIKDEFKGNLIVQRFVRQMENIKPISVGHEAPGFTIAGIDGKPVKLSDYRGKYVMIDFWASWCAPCRQENPNVVNMYNTFKSKGFDILGVSLDKEKSAWQKAIANDKLTWKHASDLQDFYGPTEKLYQIESIPSNFIIDPNGKIIAKNITGPELESFLNKTFGKL